MTALIAVLGVLALLGGVWAIDAIWDLLDPEDDGKVSERWHRGRRDRW